MGASYNSVSAVRLLYDERGKDLVFMIHGERLTCHKCVLSARSEFFTRQLEGRCVPFASCLYHHEDDPEIYAYKGIFIFPSDLSNKVLPRPQIPLYKRMLGLTRSAGIFKQSMGARNRNRGILPARQDT